jgi:hypothetical protein
MSAASDLAEFAKARKKAKRHKRRLSSGKVITVEGEAKKPTSSSAIRNLELLARSARSVTYSADTIHRMAGRMARSSQSQQKAARYGRIAEKLSREGRGWMGVVSRAGHEVRRWV